MNLGSGHPVSFPPGLPWTSSLMVLNPTPPPALPHREAFRHRVKCLVKHQCITDTQGIVPNVSLLGFPCTLVVPSAETAGSRENICSRHQPAHCLLSRHPGHSQGRLKSWGPSGPVPFASPAVEPASRCSDRTLLSPRQTCRLLANRRMKSYNTPAEVLPLRSTSYQEFRD